MLGLENPIHIMLVLVVVLMLFGAKRLPEMGRSLGSGIREFRSSVTNAAAEIEEHAHLQQAPPATTTAPSRESQPANVA